ncbi:MAG: ATPase, partial [Syntrophobacteraceae bacterium]
MHDSPKESADLAKYSVELVEASLNANYTEVRRIGNALAKSLERCGQIEEAKKIRSALRRKSVPLRASGQVESLPVDLKSRIPLIEEVPPPDTPIFLSEGANEVFHRFIEEIQHSAELSQKGLALRSSLILSGPPGTGKTLFASHVA